MNFDYSYNAGYNKALDDVLDKVLRRLDYWINHRSSCGTRTDSIQELRRIERVC